ncbi:metallopeptidase TldD-related protein [uncultured Sphingomonas sp.]|uniref:metallopeptidase TldD-related protein n=1 Tax=uncultured Sphingomonas sp. TaxID=158754 RepID=UPI0026349B03|nr:metallopeptidase TldD-related protein [uncultured Sphingomonas sp.]
MSTLPATALNTAEARLLATSGLTRDDLSRTLSVLWRRGTDLADLFFEDTRARSWRLQDGRVSAGSFRIGRGVGARAAAGADIAFAHSADLGRAALADLADTVAALGRRPGGDQADVALDMDGPVHALYAPAETTGATDAAAWIALLEQVDAAARAADPRIVRVDGMVRAIDQIVLVADIDGRIAADVRPTAQVMMSVLAEANGRRASGNAGLGGRFGLEGFTAPRVVDMVKRAVRAATTNLDARPAPAGRMPVVLAPGYAGVLFHEAVGHGLEGDHHRKRQSAFDGRMGERIAAPGVTVIDDGSLPGLRGSLGIDDEGVAGQRTVLVEDGILTGLLQDRLNAGLMNARPTGNGRRQSYAHLPMPRMTNTFLAPGRDDPAEILASVKNGIYAIGFGGGQVDIVTGRFNFSTTEAWLIEDGRLTAPIDGATLIGVGHEALKNISMVGGDLGLDEGEALCVKQGQQLDVGVGQPTIRIDDMMVGGRAGRQG